MGKTVALDSMIFIYLFEADQRYITYVEKLFRQIESGKISACTSIISVIETLSAPKFKADKDTLIELTRFFQETPGLTVLPVSWEIAEKAAMLRRQNIYLRTPDALQLATALVQNATTFVTNDLQLKKLKVPGIAIKTPLEQ